jgi:hypothetical protein
MNSRVILAAMMISAAPVLAEQVAMPEICKTTINYTAKVLNIGFEDGSFADKYDPNRIVLKKDFKKYPIVATYLGDCEEQNAKIKPEWCQVAGGSPTVFQVEVSGPDGNGGTVPEVKITVTYNRGSCWVDQVEKK